MKATGIVRRIDDLGRVVVPKEIRRTLRIREGDPLEIFTDREGEIILKKYSPIGELGQFAKQYGDALTQVTGHMVIITDRDTYVSVSGSVKKDMTGKQISKELEDSVNERESIIAVSTDKSYIKLGIEEEGDVINQVISPIICEGDAIGSVIILSKNTKVKFSEVEIKLAAAASNFLGRQMEQ